MNSFLYNHSTDYDPMLKGLMVTVAETGYFW